ncbi:hypothetical protein [Mycolicibacter hiberniae]|uniref:Uncharacterized protein n=1 Tax=Mycolicibacter hiberniae TaxID=29314 RepID=A0A7I7X9R2_9MYCO|nr:hypothetical protein [Mycolicibacter hiberniae]MCV7087170.1 hypothetical protein [Mycolicibacter hiberniae]ORV67833.1 hypothetical protein AWC09_16895 [Mycolicibacter hiberniae]BBZ25617.1 hypothetical protein MHIB_40350 [Mycolicibacter hiberniae]
MSDSQPQPAPLFFESGASWYWVLFGPISAGLLLVIQHSSGFGFQPLVPAILLVLVSLMLAIQVKAARIHTSVELTEDTLRQGTETIRVADIVALYPEAERPTGWGKQVLQKWQESRALGELSGVPRRRVGIGLRLRGRRTVQAWARDHRRLRAALGELIPETVPPGGPAETDVDDGSSW